MRAVGAERIERFGWRDAGDALGPDPAAVGFHASGPVHGFAMTVEQAGGVVRSAHQPIASATLS